MLSLDYLRYCSPEVLCEQYVVQKNVMAKAISGHGRSKSAMVAVLGGVAPVLTGYFSPVAADAGLKKSLRHAWASSYREGSQVCSVSVDIEHRGLCRDSDRPQTG